MSGVRPRAVASARRPPSSSDGRMAFLDNRSSTMERRSNNTDRSSPERMGSFRPQSASGNPQRPPPPEDNKPQWRRPSQNADAISSAARRKAYQPFNKQLVPLMQTVENLLKHDDDPRDREANAYAQRLEAAKKLTIDKVQGFISRSKAPTGDLKPKITAPICPPKFQAPKETKTKWLMALTKSKAEVMELLKDKMDQYSQPWTEEEVGDKLETSMGEDLETFSDVQGTVQRAIDNGLDDSMLDEFLFDEESERQLTTYEKWAVVRHAAEQVLNVYTNRSNARWIENTQWKPPVVVDANTVTSTLYASAVEHGILQGNIALLFIDDGRLVNCEADGVAPLLSMDLWQTMKDQLPNKVPSGQRLERLSVAGRTLLAAAVSIEMWYGEAALRNLKIVVAVDCEQENFFVKELQQWSFFGLYPKHVVILPQPRFHGFAQDMRTGRLAHVKGSAKLMLGTGYAMFLLNSPAEAYTIDTAGVPHCLQGSVLEWLRDQRSTWLYTGLLSDIQRLRPEAMVDTDFLAAAMHCVDAGGCNMAMEVVLGEKERDVRRYDSIVLGRQRRTDAPNANASVSGPSSGPGAAGPRGPGGQPVSNCDVRASAMRTVTSYKVMQQQTNNPHGFFVSTHRYVFKISTLQRLLNDANSFHVDVRLNEFCAYATFDMSDVTTFDSASCACVLGDGFPGPAMDEAVYGKNWLKETATVLEQQDKVNEFRQKAIALHAECSVGHSHQDRMPRPVSAFKERTSGFKVVMLLSPEHDHKLARMAFQLARVFLHHVVDKLSVVLLLSKFDSRDGGRAVLDKLNDRELTFNKQLFKDVIVREPDERLGDLVMGYINASEANLVVVPSQRLCGITEKDLGQVSSSVALMVAKSCTTVPVLVVKSNSVGRFCANLEPSPNTSPSRGQLPSWARGANWPDAPPAPSSGPMAGRHTHSGQASDADSDWPSGMQRQRTPGGPLSSTGRKQREPLQVMVHLEAQRVAQVVEGITQHMDPATKDVLYLARAHAFEKPGQLSMRSRRMYVQARMAVANGLRVEERAFLLSPAVELPKAVEAEAVDLLVLQMPAEQIIGRDAEDLLKTSRTSILLYRGDEGALRARQGPAREDVQAAVAAAMENTRLHSARRPRASEPVNLEVTEF